METKSHIPKSYWIIAIIALLWNSMGVFQYYKSTYELESFKETLQPEAFTIMASMPPWYTVVFAIAVLTGFCGSVLLLLKSKFAIAVLGVSLISVLIAEIYWLLGTNIIQISGFSAVVMPLFVIIIAIFLFYYSKGAARNGWIS